MDGTNWMPRRPRHGFDPDAMDRAALRTSLAMTVAAAVVGLGLTWASCLLQPHTMESAAFWASGQLSP